MDLRGALRTRLVEAATAAADRVAWLIRPSGGALPAITLQMVTGDRPQTHSGFQDTRTARVQLDVWAEDHPQATAIMDAVVLALAPAGVYHGVKFGRMFFEGEEETLEDLADKTIYRTRIDLIVWNTPA